MHADNARLRTYEYAALTDIQRWSGAPAGEGLFDTLVAFENYPLEATTAAAALPIAEVQGSERPHNPLTLACLPGPELAFRLFYDDYYYDAASLERLFADLTRVFEALAQDLSARVAAIELLSPAERRQVVSDWNATAVPYPRDASLPQLFAAQVARTPEAVAVAFGAERLSYRALDARADQLAGYLRAMGVLPGDKVAVCLDRSQRADRQHVGRILKAGGVYVPLDPSTRRNAWRSCLPIPRRRSC